MRIESVQKSFLIYALRRTVRRDAQYRLPSYASRCQSIGIESLSRRRLNLLVMFEYDLLIDRLRAPRLLSKFKINDPVRSLRNADYLSLSSHRVNYGPFEPVNNMSRAFNMFSDVYRTSVSRYGFRLAVR